MGGRDLRLDPRPGEWVVVSPVSAQTLDSRTAARGAGPRVPAAYERSLPSARERFSAESPTAARALVPLAPERSARARGAAALVPAAHEQSPHSAPERFSRNRRQPPAAPQRSFPRRTTARCTRNLSVFPGIADSRASAGDRGAAALVPVGARPPTRCFSVRPRATFSSTKHKQTLYTNKAILIAACIVLVPAHLQQQQASVS